MSQHISAEETRAGRVGSRSGPPGFASSAASGTRPRPRTVISTPSRSGPSSTAPPPSALLLIPTDLRLHNFELRADFEQWRDQMIGRRFDHEFCSSELKVLACEYLHHLREDGLSDHSALELDFDI